MSDVDESSGETSFESPASGDQQSLESLRRQAKQFLKAAKSGDANIIARLRALLPRLASLNDASVQSEIKLADVQHAMARRAGHTNWRALRAAVEALEPLQLHAERFLRAIHDEQTSRAKQLIDAHPAIARYSIHTAAAVADSLAVAELLTQDASSATRPTQPDGTEPIVYAVLDDIKSALHVGESARLETVRLLLDAGASANASVPLSDNGARIPVLYFPCVSNNVAVARLLLERGAATDDGESVYHAAQHNHRECLELLRSFGADLSGRNSEHGNTPLYFLATHRERNNLTPLCTLGMQWLLEHGADPNVPSYISASGSGVPGVSEMPLHRIAASGRPDAVARMLVEHGAIVDAPRGDGATAYVLAVRVGNTSTAQYLASVGADVSRLAPTDQLLGACATGDEAAARAIVAQHPTVIASLDREGIASLGLAVADNRESAVRLMLSLGWPLTAEGEWGGTPLHWAAWHGRIAMVRVLLDHGAPLNLRDSQYGSSPIAWAAHGSVNSGRHADDDYVAIVEMLLDAGATRAESYNSWGEAPESLARPAVARVLKVRGFAV